MERAVRDLLDESFAEIWVDDASAHATVERYLGDWDPKMAERLRLYEDRQPLFERRGVDTAIARAMRSRVWLDSGGFIVINPTEALVAIDVNSGRNTEGAELESTAFETNLEAASEVARQMRLRDLAGIIVVDFIDLLEPENRTALVAAFERALSRDPTRIQVSEMSDFGLVAVTLKRMRGGLRQRLTQICPSCSGEGRIKNPTTVGLELERAVRGQFSASAGRTLRVRLHPRTKRALEDDQKELVAAIRRGAGGQLELVADDRVGLDEFEIDSG